MNTATVQPVTSPANRVQMWIEAHWRYEAKRNEASHFGKPAVALFGAFPSLPKVKVQPFKRGPSLKELYGWTDVSFHDLAGQRFGFLTVVGQRKEYNDGNSVSWNLLCDCGRTCSERGYKLERGDRVRCRVGCAMVPKKPRDERNRLATKARYIRLREQGLCDSCGCSSPDKTRCDACSERSRLTAAARRARLRAIRAASPNKKEGLSDHQRRRARGLCSRCPAKSETTRCPACAAKDNAAWAARNAAKKATKEAA